jgi:hypothetical protein
VVVASFLPWLSWGTGLKPPRPPIEAHWLQLLGNQHHTPWLGAPKIEKHPSFEGQGGNRPVNAFWSLRAGVLSLRAGSGARPFGDGLRPIAWVGRLRSVNVASSGILPGVKHSGSECLWGRCSGSAALREHILGSSLTSLLWVPLTLAPGRESLRVW